MINEADNEGPAKDQYLKHILDYLLLRTRLTYDYAEIFHYLFKCRCLGLKRKDAGTLDKHHLLYHRGNEKLERELDVINIVK
jgi:hypothetical protein